MRCFVKNARFVGAKKNNSVFGGLNRGTAAAAHSATHVPHGHSPDYTYLLEIYYHDNVIIQLFGLN